MGIWQRVAMDILKFLPGRPCHAMPYLSMLCRQAIPETALRSFPGWPARKAGGLQPSSTPLDTPRRTPIVTVLFRLQWQGIELKVFSLYKDRKI
jgi:hypothetical protein